MDSQNDEILFIKKRDVVKRLFFRNYVVKRHNGRHYFLKSLKTNNLSHLFNSFSSTLVRFFSTHRNNF